MKINKSARSLDANPAKLLNYRVRQLAASRETRNYKSNLIARLPLVLGS